MVLLIRGGDGRRMATSSALSAFFNSLLFTEVNFGS
jgi:hypothetical protein